VFTNLRWVPAVIYQGGTDNNVPITNGQAAADALTARGYRYRMYVFPADNHFSPGAVDRWEEAVSYLNAAPRIDPNPARVSYVRDMAFESDVNRAAFSDQQIFPPGGHQLRFDHAYWMSELTPSDPTNGVASVDATSLAIASRPTRTQAESGAGGSPDPYAWTGHSWAPAGARARTANGFKAEINGASAVRFDARRMRLDLSRPISVDVRNDRALELRLAVANRPDIVLHLPPGRNSLQIAPVSAAR
jgi:hypothetical protein